MKHHYALAVHDKTTGKTVSRGGLLCDTIQGVINLYTLYHAAHNKVSKENIKTVESRRKII